MSEAERETSVRATTQSPERDALNLLTPAQRAIVTHGDGPLLVVAGAGTGKTSVLVQRIAYLIRDRRVPPQKILTLTFTEKAAAEIVQRADLALPISAHAPWIGTFHGFCEYVLREEALHLGLDSRFSVLSAPETWLLLKRNLFTLPLSRYRPLGNPTKFVQALGEFFSQAKDQGVTPEMLEEYASRKRGEAAEAEDEAARWEELAAVLRGYVALQRAEGVMDFGDLILETLRLFRERPAVLAKYRALFPYVLVDEFQDTNATQGILLELLAGSNGNLTVVSDDDQAIFAFRGSNVGNVLTFQARFPSAVTFSLTDNFRSPQVVLDHAYALIQHNNPYRLETTAGISKRLKSRTNNQPGGDAEKIVTHRQFDAEEAELAWVAEEILRLVDGGAAYRDIAILLRKNAQAADVVPSLIRRDIPHTVTESRGLLARPEVKDVLAYFRLLVRPDDGPALFRLLAHAAFSVRAADRASILAELRRKSSAALPLLQSPDLLARLSPGSLAGIARLASLLEHHLTVLRTLRPSTVFLEFIERSGVLKHAVEESAQAPEVLPNLQAFLAYIRDLERGLDAGDLLEFFELLDAAVSASEGPPAAGLPYETDTVRVFTVHAAKGLEFPFVFIVGATADRYPARGRRRPLELPSSLAPMPEALPELEDREVNLLEERRLFYVALTRAQQRLIITSSAVSGGSRRTRKPSPFITEAGILSERHVTAEASPEQQLALPGIAAKRPRQGFRAPADGSLALSASGISEYETCPLKYEFKRVLRVPTPPHHAFSFGVTVHDVLRDLGSLVSAGKRPTIADALRLYDTHWRPEGYESAEHEAARKASGRERLPVYLAAHPEILTQVPLAVEAPFLLTVGEFRLAGRIDRVDRLPDGRVVVTDFKTGSKGGAGPTSLKLPTSPSGLRGTGRGAGKSKEADADVQLSIYALALRRAFHWNPDLLRLSYVEEARDEETTRTADDDTRTAERAENVAQRIRAGDFAASPGFHCRFCDFRNICDFAELP